MAYETGAASSPADLLSKLATFAAANGWTVSTPTSGRVFEKGTIFCGANSDANGFSLRGCLSYNAGAAWNAQPNASSQTPYCNTGAGPFTAYHFFIGEEGTSDYINVVVEISVGVYRHAIICGVVKAGAWTGGTYVDSVFHDTGATRINLPESPWHRYIADTDHTQIGGTVCGSMYCDADGRVNSWSPIYAYDNLAVENAIGSMRTRGMLWNLYNVGYARWNLRTILEPIWIFQNRGSSLRSPAGRLPNMRFVNMINFTPGDLYTVGGETWQVFPVIARTETWDASPSTTPSSAHHGYAYLRSET